MIRFLIGVSAIAIGLGSASTAVVAQQECPHLSNYMLDEFGNCVDLDRWNPSAPTVTEGRLLDEISLDVGALYPGKDLPWQTVIDLDKNTNVSEIGILTDWWQKRPTRIQVYEWQDGKRGKFLGGARFPSTWKTFAGRNSIASARGWKTTKVRQSLSSKFPSTRRQPAMPLRSKSMDCSAQPTNTSC